MEWLKLSYWHLRCAALSNMEEDIPPLKFLVAAGVAFERHSELNYFVSSL